MKICNLSTYHNQLLRKVFNKVPVKTVTAKKIHTRAVIISVMSPTTTCEGVRSLHLVCNESESSCFV